MSPLGTQKLVTRQTFGAVSPTECFDLQLQNNLEGRGPEFNEIMCLVKTWEPIHFGLPHARQDGVDRFRSCATDGKTPASVTVLGQSGLRQSAYYGCTYTDFERCIPTCNTCDQGTCPPSCFGSCGETCEPPC